jgi:hypothetical protein
VHGAPFPLDLGAEILGQLLKRPGNREGAAT